MFGWEFPPYNSGGLGVACRGLTRALVRNDVEVVFVLPRKIPITPDFMEMLFADKVSSVTIKRIDTLLSAYATSESYKEEYETVESSIYKGTLYEEVLRYAQAAKKIAQEEKFDIIYTHDWLSFRAGIEAKKVNKKPHIAHIHATEFDRCGGDNVNEKIAVIEKEGLEQADCVVAVSNYTKKIIVNKYQISEEKVYVVYNGIDKEDFPTYNAKSKTLRNLKENGTKIVLFVGRLTLQKGLEYFLSAAKKALNVNQNIIFVIAGTGDMENQIIRQVSEMGISDKVLFMGFVRGEELQDVYKVADLYIMPSVSEPFGITALESMLHSTPTMVSKQSGVSEVANHILKVDFWDTTEMANKILAVINHNTLRQELAGNGFREVSNLTWDASAKKCIDVFSKI